MILTSLGSILSFLSFDFIALVLLIEFTTTSVEFFCGLDCLLKKGRFGEQPALPKSNSIKISRISNF